MSLSYTFNDLTSFQEMLQDRLQIAGEDHSDVAQFYSERGYPILGETQEDVDARLLRDAEREAKEYFHPDETGKARTHAARDSELNIRTGALRERLESAIYEEMLNNEGRGLHPKKGAWLDEGIRNIKATYITTRVTAENSPEDPTEKHPFLAKSGTPISHQNKKALSLMWLVDTYHVVAMNISQYGKEREIQLFKSETPIERSKQSDWTEIYNLGGIEFPLHQVSKEQDKSGKWVFRMLPKIPYLVAILKDQLLRFRTEEIKDLFSSIYESHLKMLEEETTVPYIPLSADDMILYNEEIEGFHYEPDFWEQELQNHKSSLTLTEWSRWITQKIVQTMDPEGKGEATQPMQIVNGKCWSGYTRKRAPLHKSVKQSLFWLLGSARYQKRGFVSHPGLTREDRELLINLGKAWWKVINDREVLQSTQQTNEMPPEELFIEDPIVQDTVTGIASLMAFMDASGATEVSNVTH
jgi:hypothetical protein